MPDAMTVEAPSAPAPSPAPSTGTAGTSSSSVPAQQAVSEMAEQTAARPRMRPTNSPSPEAAREAWAKKNVIKTDRTPGEAPLPQAGEAFRTPIEDRTTDASPTATAAANADGTPSPTSQPTPLTDKEKTLIGKFQLPLNPVEQRVLGMLSQDERAVFIESLRKRDQLASTHMRWLADQKKAQAAQAAQSAAKPAQGTQAQSASPAATPVVGQLADDGKDEELDLIDKMLGEEGKPSPLRNVLSRREAQFMSRLEAQQSQREQNLLKQIEQIAGKRVEASTAHLYQQLEHEHVEAGFAQVKLPEGVEDNEQNRAKVVETAKMLFQTKRQQPDFDFRKTNLKTLMPLAASITFKEQFDQQQQQQRSQEAQDHRRGSALPVGNRPAGSPNATPNTREGQRERWLQENKSKLIANARGG